MPAPPTRASLFNPLSKALANTRFGELYDYVVTLLGATGTTADAQTALGATATGKALFTAATAAAARSAVGASSIGASLLTATDAAAAKVAIGVPNSGPLSGLRNLIINGNFTVNQRAYGVATAVGSANTYTLDRWRVVVSGQSLNWSASGAGNLATAPAGGLEQVVEGAAIGGGTYTINWTGTATCTVNGTAQAKLSSFTLTAGSNATVRLSNGTVGELQIEPGNVATPFELRPPALELVLCQRYCATADAEFGFDGTLGGATVSTGATWFLPVEMRAMPTLSVVSEAGSNCSAIISTSAKSKRGAYVSWQWQNGTSVVARNKAAVIMATAEL